MMNRGISFVFFFRGFLRRENPFLGVYFFQECRSVGVTLRFFRSAGV